MRTPIGTTLLNVGLLTTFAFGACQCEEPLQVLAPKIEIGDPYDADFSVCAKDKVRDCAFDFGTVGVGQPRIFSFLIQNPTAVDLTIESIKFEDGSDAAFTLEGEVPTIIENEVGVAGKVVSVKFKPAFESTVHAKLIIVSDAQNLDTKKNENVVIDISGTGGHVGDPDIRIEPPECEFGDVGIGATAFCDISVFNDGNLDLVLDDVGFDDMSTYGPAPKIFEEGSVLIIPTVILPGTGITIRLKAHPPDQNDYTNALTLHTNDPDEENVEVPMHVKGALTPTCNIRVKSINGTPNSNTTPALEPLDNVELSGDQSIPGTAGGTITAYHYELVNPPTSNVDLTTPNARETRFDFNSSGGTQQGLPVAGTYTVKLTVTDNTGGTDDCTILLNAVPGEGIHVELTWNTVTDQDLHLRRGQTSQWCSNDDCHWLNDSPNWGSPAQSPSLDIDVITQGYGPENINIDSPPIGANYTIGVDYYSGNPDTEITIKVYLAGALAATYNRTLENVKDMWTVARIDVDNTGSHLTPIDTVQNSPPSAGSCL